MVREVIAEKRGYLNEDFKLFHIKDQKETEFQYHSHDFHKIIVFISGKVLYHIEGRTYKLRPWDILLVGDTEIHMPQIDCTEPYERVVLWVYPEYLKRCSTEKTDLESCFKSSSEREYHLIRLDKDKLRGVMEILQSIETETSSKRMGKDILQNSLFLQLMVSLNRLYSGADVKSIGEEEYYSEEISEIINYINQNIKEKISIQDIATRFYMSRYYLMHKFKRETGTSVYSYIISKRLIMARALIREGRAIVEVAQECGFGDYSSFERAFKKAFGTTPRKYGRNGKAPSFDLNDMDI